MSVRPGLLFIGFDELVPCRLDWSFLVNTAIDSHVIIDTATDSHDFVRFSLFLDLE